MTVFTRSQPLECVGWEGLKSCCKNSKNFNINIFTILTNGILRNATLRMHSLTCDAAFEHAGDSDLNMIVTERPQRTPSVSQHLEFISSIDKHKYSHIILHKPPNISCTPCCQRLGGLSVCLLWQDKRDWLWGELHFCQQTVKTVTWQRSISWRLGEERRRLRSDSQPLRSHLLSVLTFQSVLYHVRMWFENVPLTLRFWAVENRSECVSCFRACLRTSKPNTNRPWYFM